MKELRDILDAVAEVRRQSQPAALVTVVKAQGSTYRRPGARMIVRPDGTMVGSISGGCLEGDVLEKARQVLVAGTPRLVTYDMTSDDDIVWGLGLGCNGVVHVLIEPLPPGGPADPMAFLEECMTHERVGVMATVFRVGGRLAAHVGDRWMVRADGQLWGSSLQDTALIEGLRPDVDEAYRTGRSKVRTYALPDGEAEVFIEVVQPPVPLVVFGAGHDAIPVVRSAKALGWRVTVVDSRPAYATRDRFPEADEVILAHPEDVPGRIRLDDRTVAVVMTHNYLQDLKLLEVLLPSPVRYLGVLGPRSRTDKLLGDLRAKGRTPTETQLSRLYSPVGVDIGAETPEEIALSILAEIQAVLTGRSAGLLRDRKGPIHERTEGT
ncbi:MAG: XdhC family protein [Acidobacteria bacterium]|nr:XdhC family protein [Acidobacteriota bacterium]MDW7983382.1 XdhC family protein [Acidobacteriota bacterium]